MELVSRDGGVRASGCAGASLARAPSRRRRLGCGAGRPTPSVWGYVDDEGVAHFAAEKVDERYELFFRGGESFDTSEGVPGKTPRAGAVPTASHLAAARLLRGLARLQAASSTTLREASRRHGIDYELLQALIATESGFDAARGVAQGRGRA